MNVIASGGLVGIVSEVGKSYAKVRSIIDDNSYVSGMFLRTKDMCDVKGNLKTLAEGFIDVERISIDAEVEDGFEVVTSYQSDKYLEGILIGYVSNVTPDTNNMTMTARITPAVDFSKLDKVLADYDDSFLLQVLDGSDTKGKHMILFTCNDDSEISEYLIDRCSRIRYWREFDEMSPSLIMEI